MSSHRSSFSTEGVKASSPNQQKARLQSWLCPARDNVPYFDKADRSTQVVCMCRRPQGRLKHPGGVHVQGHTATIEDVVWRPGSRDELASVGDDYMLLLWDSRLSSGRPCAAVAEAHGQTDVQCVDWSTLQQELLVTGTVPVAWGVDWLLAPYTERTRQHALYLLCYPVYTVSTLGKL